MKLLFSLFVFFIFFAACENKTQRVVIHDSEKTIAADDATPESEVITDDAAEVSDTDCQDNSPDEDIEIPDTEEAGQTEADEVPDIDVDLGDCPELSAGWNNDFEVKNEQKGSILRSFILTLPEGINQKRSWPLIFNWHGVGATADGFLPTLDFFVNNDIMPFILVTPEDTNLPMATVPPQGVDWDNLVLNDGNIEADLFDRVIECLDRQFGIDRTHIHTTGFSAGSIASDSLGVMRGDQIASILTYSGAYFSDAKNPEDIGKIMGVSIAQFIHWPEMLVSNKYTQVLVHGASDDFCNTPSGCDRFTSTGLSISFNHMALNDAPYLSGLGHDVIICNHGQGHIMAGISQLGMIGFFKDHPLGTEISPYRKGLPEEFGAICSFVAAK